MKRFLASILTLGLVGAALAQAPADTYVHQVYGDPVTLDPARAYDTASGAIIENVYETLFTYADPAIDEFEPALATDYTVSEDGLTYTFQLRPDVQFHSGNTLTCRDVEYSFERGFVTAPAEGAVNYLFGNEVLGTQITGADPAAYQEEVTWEEIDAAFECPEGDDALTFEINLQNASPATIAILAYTAFSILDSQWAIEQGAWDGTGETWTEWIGRDLTQEALHDAASGTGAYQLVNWEGNTVVAEAFENYWGGAPTIQNVVVENVEEQSTRILALQQGDADRINLNERAALVQLRGAPGITVHEDPEWAPACVSNVFFNFDIATENNEDVGTGELGGGIPADFFADPDVRRGFAHLFDQQGFIEQVYDGQGRALTMGLPPSFLGYNEDVPIRTLDLEAAEQYFREAYDGRLWEEGFEFTALYNAGNTVRQTVLEIIAENLEFINPNFVMNVRSLPWPDFLARVDQRMAPLFALGWCADYADPANFINTFYDNDGYYASDTSIDIPEIQALIDQADQITDPVERGFIYRDIGTLHYEHAPLVVYPVQNPFIVTSDALEGVYFNPMRSAEFLWRDIAKN